MRVRVYDREKDKYFKSEVYAVIDRERYLVLEPSGEKELLRFIDSGSGTWPDRAVNINLITPEIPQYWVEINGEALPPLNEKLKQKGSALSLGFEGYAWLIKDLELLASLMNGSVVDWDDDRHADKRVCSKLPEWNYVDTQADVKTLMDAYGGFHDSCLTRLGYISGGKVYKEDHGMMPFDKIRQMTMFFESQCRDGIEMVFEGVTEMNLRPALDEQDNIVYGATLVLNDEEVYFCGGYKADPATYDGTWIKAFGLRWRLLPLTD